jgi:hypothetical protein
MISMNNLIWFSCIHAKCKQWSGVSPITFKNKKCPFCGNSYGVIVIADNAPNLFPTSFKVYTYAKKMRTVANFKSYPDDLILTTLKNFGFRERISGGFSPYQFDKLIVFDGPNGTVASFYAGNKKRKTTDLYLFVSLNDPIIEAINIAVKKQKQEHKLAELIKEKEPSIETMSDARGNLLKVGNWVVYWTSGSLGFGKIKDFKKTLIYGTTTIIARITNNGITSPFKTSDQIFAIPENQAFLMEMES